MGGGRHVVATTVQIQLRVVSVTVNVHVVFCWVVFQVNGAETEKARDEWDGRYKVQKINTQLWSGPLNFLVPWTMTLPVLPSRSH